MVKDLPAMWEDLGSIPGPGRSPVEGYGNPRQYSCLENSMDRGAWRAIVHAVSMSQTQVRKGGGEEIPLVQGKEQWLSFAGAAVKRYPTPKVTETQVRR